MLEYSKPVLKPSQWGLPFPPTGAWGGCGCRQRLPLQDMSIQKVCKALYSSEGNDLGLRKETHGFLLTASNSVLPAAFLSLGLALMKETLMSPVSGPSRGRDAERLHFLEGAPLRAFLPYL